MEELEQESKIAREDMVMALEACAEIESIYRPIYQGDGTAVMLMDKLEEKENANEKILNHMMLEQLLKNLEQQERHLIDLRYFKEQTQNQTAKALGLSQVQVSRLEKKILKKLKNNSL